MPSVDAVVKYRCLFQIYLPCALKDYAHLFVACHGSYGTTMQYREMTILAMVAWLGYSV